MISRRKGCLSTHPLHYIVDFSAAYAIFNPFGPLEAWLWIRTHRSHKDQVVEQFLVRTVRAYPSARTSITITHQDGITYGPEVATSSLKMYSAIPFNFDTVFRSPPPDSWYRGQLLPGAQVLADFTSRSVNSASTVIVPLSSEASIEYLSSLNEYYNCHSCCMRLFNANEGLVRELCSKGIAFV
jgi:hypothetical protein